MHERLLQKLYCVPSTKKEMFKKSVEVSTAISLNIGVSILPSDSLATLAETLNKGRRRSRLVG